MKKILVITGSHRPRENTYSLAERFSSKLNDQKNIQIEIAELAKMNVQGCCGTAACAQTEEKRCVHKQDDFTSLFNNMIASDAVLFIVPKYAPYPSRLLAVIERLMAISYWGYGEKGKIDEFVLYGKPAAMVAFSSTPGIPAEVFFPLFFGFAEAGFTPILFNNLPGLYFNKADGKEEEMLEMVANAFTERLT